MTAPRDDAALLKAVRERLADEARWTKGKAARDANGIGTQFESAAAACFCLVGAIWCEFPNSYLSQKETNRIAAMLEFQNWEAASFWNDAPERTHADVIARLDTALARLSADDNRESGNG